MKNFNYKGLKYSIIETNNIYKLDEDKLHKFIEDYIKLFFFNLKSIEFLLKTCDENHIVKYNRCYKIKFTNFISYLRNRKLKIILENE